MTLDDLIVLLEKAEKPSDELDALIFAATHNPPMLVKRYPPTDDFGPKDRWQFWTLDGTYFLGSEGRFKYKAVTSSIDAALTLVPEGFSRWSIESVATPVLVVIEKKKKKHTHEAYISNVHKHDIGTKPFKSFQATAFTPAIALCIAALKARKEQP